MSFGDFLEKNYKTLVMVLTAIICVSIIYIMFALILHGHKDTYVNISVAPYNATVKINNKEYSTGTHKIDPGEYKVVVSADGFETKELDLKVKSGAIASVVTYLVNKEEGMKYYERDRHDLALLQTMDTENDERLKEFLDYYDKKLEVVNVLPMDVSYNDPTYNDRLTGHTVKAYMEDGSSEDDCERAFCIKLSGIRIDKEKIAKILAEKGYNLDDYFIVYEYVRGDF